MELRFHDRLQIPLGHCLRDAIGDRRDAQRPHASVSFGDLHEPDRTWKVRPRGHPIPDLVEVPLQIRLERFDGLSVHSRRAAIRLNALVRFPHLLLGNLKRLCLIHELLPSRVDPQIRPGGSTPLLHRRYSASSLVRVDPSLRSASVLCSSRVCRLESSLHIGAVVSHVP